MIRFESIKWSNFGSYGDVPFEMSFADAKVWAFTGKNGSGKSQLLDAMSFVLYGKPWRKIVKAKLVNNKNKRGLRVELKFNAPSGSYKVVRGIKPDVFEIWRDGSLINQDSKARDYQKTLEEDILGLSWDAFNQVVVVGKATYTPFMQLDTPKRRAFVESVLGLQIFTEMRKLQAADSSELDRKTSAANATLEATRPLIEQSEAALQELMDMKGAGVDKEIEELIEAQGLAESHLNDVQAEHVFCEAACRDIEARFKIERADLIAKTEQIAREAKQLLDIVQAEQDDVVSKASALLSEQNVVRAEVKRLTAELSSLDTSTVCPSCGGPIDASQVIAHKAEIEAEIAKAREKIASFDAKIAAVDDEKAAARQKTLSASTAWGEAIKAEREAQSVGVETVPEWRQAAEKLKEVESEVNTTTRDIREIQTRLVEAERRRDGLDDMIDRAVKTREENAIRLASAEENVAVCDFAGQVMSATSAMLKDTGVKATIVRRYIPTINDLVNRLLVDMGFFAVFSLDENFDDKILSKGFEEMTYNGFSEGEKLRIDMAVLMAWRELCVMTGSSSTNLLIFDEILDASFDQEGLDAFLTALTRQEDLSIVCITHHVDRMDHFVERQIRFEKVDGYSRYAEAQE